MGVVGAAWQELAFPPLSVEGTLLCSATAFQLGLGISAGFRAWHSKAAVISCGLFG